MNDWVNRPLLTVSLPLRLQTPQTGRGIYASALVLEAKEMFIAYSQLPPLILTVYLSEYQYNTQVQAEDTAYKFTPTLQNSIKDFLDSSEMDRDCVIERDTLSDTSYSWISSNRLEVQYQKRGEMDGTVE